jgi:hypothetical protein
VSDLQASQPTPTSTLIPLALAGERSGYSKASMYRFASEGKIALVRRGGRTFVEGYELERFMREGVKPFRPGERVIGNAGGHRPPRRRKAEEENRTA